MFASDDISLTGEVTLGNWWIYDNYNENAGARVDVAITRNGQGIFVIGSGIHYDPASPIYTPPLDERFPEFIGIHNLRLIAHDQPQYTVLSPRPFFPISVLWPLGVSFPTQSVILPNFDGSTLTGTITFEAGYGNDFLDASAVSNVIVARGAAGNDRLIGGRRDDFIQGDAGYDTLTGNEGYDTATWESARREYEVRTFADNGVLKTMVVHQGGSQVDGDDTLIGIEALRFSDHTFGLSRGQLNHMANVDGDRFDDVLFQNAITGQVYFAKMVDGTFQSWGVDTGTLGGGDWKAIGSGDVNPGPTGGAETFIQQQSSGAIYYASLDTGAVTWGVVDVAPGVDWKLRAIGDMNGDAAADAVLQNTTTGAVKYGAMFNGQFAGYDLVTDSLSANWSLIGVGDINQDGRADAVVQNQSTGTIYYVGVANGVQSWGVVSDSLTNDWHAKAIADLTGDGFADVAVQQASTGTTYFADMAGGVLDRWGVVAGNVTPDWVVKGTADVDNDGFADVLFQNTANGTTYYAHMGPSGFTGWGVAANNITSDWHVV